MLKSPLISKSLPCPACKKEHQQRFFRQRMFVPNVVESDQHVVSYKWLANDVEKAYPGYYFVYFCPSCGYADTTEDFAKPPASPALGQVLKEYRKNGTADPVAQMLVKEIDYANIDFTGALRLYLLALRVHSMGADESIRDTYKLGRICLRIAWLYRERNAAAQEPDADAAPETLDQGLAELRALWPDAPLTERDAMLMAVQFFKRALLTDTRFDSTANHMKVSLLTADLAIRCDDYAAAMEVARGMYQPAVDERGRIQEKMQKKDTPESEQRQLQVGMKRVSEALERAGELRREILEMMEKREMPRITRIARETGAKGDDLERALLDNGIFPEVVAELKGRDALRRF
ncbi:MAG: DUF2225 domain-containing protein [Candidatus Hydrogenedentes bacterium]|nr:DUF2225 domain-containing protein [Candidatus Hydrogenedentota bacterium]